MAPQVLAAVVAAVLVVLVRQRAVRISVAAVAAVLPLLMAQQAAPAS
jgi:hypothetical protein